MSVMGDKIAAESLKYVGAPYEYAGKGPHSFDCSGFVAFIIKRVTGIQISPASSAQANVGTAVRESAIMAGDILGWDTGGGPWSHVGIAIDGNHMMNCLNTDDDCQISDLTNDYWTNQVRFSGARRVVSEGSPIVPDETITFGRVPRPKYITDLIVKPWVGAGYDVVPPRNNVGMCMHKWWGFGDEHSISRLMSTGGERQADAMVDWSCTQEGVLTMCNEPWKTRAGWANGPADGLEGDGTLFVRKLGVSAVNGRLVSCEFEGKDEPLTTLQMQQGSSLWAFYYDQWHVPYTDYPMHPKYGIVTDLDHWEIGGKECPFAGARGQRTQFQDMVRGKMKAGQVGATPDPIPPVVPPEPDHAWLPDNLTEAAVRALFGRLTRHDVDGSTRPVPFDPTGTISNSWLARGAKIGVYPEAQDWWRVADAANNTVRNIVTFEGGHVLLGNDNGREPWRWL